MDNSKSSKYIKSFIIFLLLIFVTFYIIFKDQSIDDLVRVIVNSKWEYIAIGFLTMFFFLCLEATNIKRMLNSLGENVKFFQCLKYAFVRLFL